MIPFVPRDYQKLARDFVLDAQRCNLWAVPGLGKTSTIYSVLDILKLAGSTFFPVLVLAPLKVAQLVWPAEQQKWIEFQGLRVVTILGDARQRENALLTRADVYVINYENAEWLVNFLGDRWPFRIVVADESTRLKSFRLKQGGKRAQALSQIARLTGRWVNLTGTPAPNGYKDLWGQQWFVDFGHRLGASFTAYMNRWFIQNQYSKLVIPRPGAVEEIDAKLADCAMALRAEDWLPIEKPQQFIREVELPDEARQLYKQMEKDFFIQMLTGEAEAFNEAAKSQKLLQMASGAVYDANKKPLFIHDAKIEGLRSLIEELSGEPLLVAYWYQFEPPMLKAAFPEIRFMKDKKDQDDWNAGKIPLMGINPGSGGHGIDLQHGGRAICFFTQIWDLELRMQVIERIGPVRQFQSGYKRTVLVYDLCAKSTLDVEVIERTDSKRSIQAALMAARARSAA